jgi:hypothetical protein
LPHSQTPAAQVPLSPVLVMEQLEPVATQRFEEQQSPLAAHLLPAQHGLLVTPHGLHTLLLLSQDSVVSEQRLPAQQGSPAPPHFRH